MPQTTLILGVCTLYVWWVIIRECNLRSCYGIQGMNLLKPCKVRLQFAILLTSAHQSVTPPEKMKVHILCEALLSLTNSWTTCFSCQWVKSLWCLSGTAPSSSFQHGNQEMDLVLRGFGSVSFCLLAEFKGCYRSKIMPTMIFLVLLHSR